MPVKDERSPTVKRRGVIAVCPRGSELLVIKRSDHVPAPGKYCFPGGGIEAGESEEEALVRELDEELGVCVTPIRRLWQSETHWSVELCWWLTDFDQSEAIRPNPNEVAEFHWLSPEGIRALSGVLSSNVAFLDALSAGEFSLDISCD